MGQIFLNIMLNNFINHIEKMKVNSVENLTEIKYLFSKKEEKIHYIICSKFIFQESIEF